MAWPFISSDAKRPRWVTGRWHRSDYCSGIGNHVVERVRPKDEGVAPAGNAGLDRQVQGAGGADGQPDPGGQVADLGYQQPAGGDRVCLGMRRAPRVPWGRRGGVAGGPA